MKWSNHAVRKQQLIPSSSASSVIVDLKLLAAFAIQTYCYVFAEGGKQQGNAIGRGGVGGLGGGGIGNEGAAGNVSQHFTPRPCSRCSPMLNANSSVCL